MEARIASGHCAPDASMAAADKVASDNNAAPAEVADVETVAVLRPRLRAARAALSDAQRDAANERIADHLDNWAVTALTRPTRKGSTQRVLAAFWPLGSEPDLSDWLMRQSADPDLVLALPVVVERDAPLVFKRWWPGAPMREGAYGIAEPDHDQVVVPDVILLPALGFTAEADRIGYGGGYYDRTLAAFDTAGRQVTTIVVAYACGLLPAGTHLPAAHDRRVDAVVSEAGWLPKMPD